MSQFSSKEERVVMSGWSLFRMMIVFLLGNATVWADDANSPRPQWTNLAADRPARFGTAPNYGLSNDDDDVAQFTDGKLSETTPMWTDKAAVGWVGVDPCVFTVDLGSDQPIRGVALRAAAGLAGVEWPASIQMYVSVTGGKFSLIGDVMQRLDDELPKDGYKARWLIADKLQTHGRYVKFVCEPADLGNGAYIFFDEVEIYAGDRSWLSQPLKFAEAPTRWEADWSNIRWRDHRMAISAAERPTHLRIVDGDKVHGGDTPLQSMVVDDDGATFSLKGEAGRVRKMRWSGQLAEPLSVERCRHALLTFRAHGLQRIFDPPPLVQLRGVDARTGNNSFELLPTNAAMSDGRPHTLLTELPASFTLHQITVTIVTQSDAPRLTLERFELLDQPPAVFNTEVEADASSLPPGFVAAPLDGRLDGTLSQWHVQSRNDHGILLDGVVTLDPGPVVVSGAPFIIAGGPHNLALMPRSTPIEGHVTFLEQQVARRYLHPPSRHDTLNIDVDVQAREALLLLATSAPAIQQRGGLPPAATRLDDIESLSVELTYDRGESEFAFPYSLADQGCYIPARSLGACAVAVDPARRLRKVTLHNRQFGPHFALAGLTFNTSERSMVPELAQIVRPAPTRKNSEPTTRSATIIRDGDCLTISNRWYTYRIDLSEGFVIDHAVNRFSAKTPIVLAPNSGLRLRDGDTVYTGRCFTSKVVELSQTRAVLKLSSRIKDLPVDLRVVISADDSPELSFTVETINRGDAPLEVETCLPALSGLAIGDLASTRLFFPQYRAVDTANHIALRAPYGPEFTGQFMDVYNPGAGAGLMLRTDNRQQAMADFTLRKDNAGISGGVCFPARYGRVAPGASRVYPPVALIMHSGDWHTAVQHYRDWLKNWYAPHKAQDKEFLLNAWDGACYRPSERTSWSDAKHPGFISPDRKRWFIDEVFEFEQKHFGHVPDMIHFFNWTHNDTLDRHEYGVHGTPLAYQQVGGLEFFREGIARMQEKWRRPVSLYTLPDRFRASSLPDQELAKALIADTRYFTQENYDTTAALRGSDQKDGVYYPPIGDDRWINFFVKDVARMQRDTGCKMVYVDVFPYFSHLTCQEGSTPLSVSLKLVKALREALPPDVALWSEYPCTDVASQYADASLHYYFLDLNEVFCRPYNRSERAGELYVEMPLNVQRFVLTHYKVVTLAAYIEGGSKPSQIDAAFFNGEANQENTYQLHHSRQREKLNRSYMLKRKYTDCFRSDAPTPRVPTLAEGLFANRFPGDGRNLWTVYNGRPRTYSGAVIAVPHQSGATYRDASNDRDLQPRIENGVAMIALTLHPQQPGCVVQELANSDDRRSLKRRLNAQDVQ